MKGKWFLYLLIAVLIFFVTSICVAAPGKNKGSTSTNRQTLETSTQGKERAKLRHQMKEEDGLGKESDDSVEKDDDHEEKEKKVKDKKSKDDNGSSDDSDDKQDNVSDEEP